MNILRRIWEWWKAVGQAIGDFIGRIVLSIFYFTVFMPFGIAVRLFADKLDTKPEAESVWKQRALYEIAMNDLRRLS